MRQGLVYPMMIALLNVTACKGLKQVTSSDRAFPDVANSDGGSPAQDAQVNGPNDLDASGETAETGIAPDSIPAIDESAAAIDQSRSDSGVMDAMAPDLPGDAAADAAPIALAPGQLVWAKKIGVIGSAVTRQIAAAGSTLRLLGNASGTATFGPKVVLQNPSADYFLASFDGDGIAAWVRRVGPARGGTVHVSPYPLATQATGESFLASGYVSQTYIGDGVSQVALASMGKNNYFARWSATGELDWARTSRVVSGIGFQDEGTSTPLAGGTFVSCATYQGQVAFGTAPGEFQVSDTVEGLYLTAYASDGHPLWAKSNAGSLCGAATSAPDGTLFTTGSFSENATFGAGEPNMRTLSEGGAYLARYQATGGLLSADRIAIATDKGIQRRVWISGLTTQSDGSLLVAGSYELSVTIDPDSPKPFMFRLPNADLDLGRPPLTGSFVARFDRDRKLIWAKALAGTVDTQDVIVKSAARLADGSLVLIGMVDNGPVVFSRGEPAQQVLAGPPAFAFLARYRPDGSVAWTRKLSVAVFAVGLSVTALPDDSVVVAGSYDAPVTFGAGERNETTLVRETGESSNIFLAKFAP
jgi:hypothetical protein